MRGAAVTAPVVLVLACANDYARVVVGSDADAGTAGGESSGMTTAAGGSGSSTASTSGGGGAGGRPTRPICGDRRVEGTEQCDDGDEDATDGCDACTIVCEAPDWLDVSSGHCYHRQPKDSQSSSSVGVTVGSGGGTESQRSFQEMLAACDTWRAGAYLAVLTTQVESDAVHAALVSGLGAAFIGAHDPAFDPSEGDTWVWGDGEPWAFTSWEDGQPDWDHEDCGILWDNGTWHNDECDIQWDVLCEWAP